jgi:hypothetical protein
MERKFFPIFVNEICRRDGFQGKEPAKEAGSQRGGGLDAGV